MNTFYRNYGKRALDLALCLPAAILLAPLLLLTTVAVWISMGRPALFRQARGGKDGRTFTLVKFRTMSDLSADPAADNSDAARLTRTGRLLRTLSLDELPQILNVLKGDMSLIGPRPLLAVYLERYSPEQARRHEVRPGITGWAQVKGRNALSWEEKFQLDVWYVDHVSFLLDLKILWLTFAALFHRRGIDAAGQTGMPEFMGNEESS